MIKMTWHREFWLLQISLWLVSLCIMEDVQYLPDGRQAECFVKRHNVVHGWHDAFKEFWREFKRGNALFWLIVLSDEVSFKMSAEILREEQMFACVRSLMKPQDIAQASVMMSVTVAAAFCCRFSYSWARGERELCSPKTGSGMKLQGIAWPVFDCKKKKKKTYSCDSWVIYGNNITYITGCYLVNFIF